MPPISGDIQFYPESRGNKKLIWVYYPDREPFRVILTNSTDSKNTTLA